MASTINATPTSSGLIQSADNSGVLALQTGGTTAVTIDGSQNVGIGTSSPSTKLQLGGAVNQTLRIDSATGNAAFFGGFNTFTIMASNRNPNTGVFVDTGKASGSISIDANTGVSDIRFQTTTSNNTEPTERMRIDSSGNLLVGCTSAPGNVPNEAGLFITGNGFAAYRVATNGTFAQEFFNASGASVGNITVGASTTTYNATSDYRLKTVIAPISNPGQRIDALQPIEYDWKIGGRTRGFLAHQFAEVYPDSVTGEKDAVNEEGTPIYQSMQAATSEVMADLIAEIQSLRKRVAQLETK